jgi:hypothetical protein
MIATVVLISVLIVTAGVVIVAYRERARLGREVRAVEEGIEMRTAPGGEAVSARHQASNRPLAHVQELLDEAIQMTEHGLAVLAVNELTGRAVLARNRALLLARGLARIALLSGAGGAFVLVAVGHFGERALVQGGASVLMGVVSSFLCHGLTVSMRGLARKYCAMTDVLARQLEHQIKHSDFPE